MTQVFAYTGVTSGGVVATDESDVDSTTGRPDILTAVSKTAGLTIKHDTAHLTNGHPMIRMTRAATTDSGYVRKALASAVTRLQASVYVWFDSLPSGAGNECNIFVFRHAAGFMGYLGISKTGGTANRLALANTSNSIISGTTATADFPTGQLVRIEAAIKKGTTTTDGTIGYGYALGNSTTYVYEVTSTTANTGTADPIEVRLGLNGATISPANVWYGDFRLGDGATSWLGPNTGGPPVAIVNGQFMYLIDATTSTNADTVAGFSITQLTGPTPASIDEFVEGKWMIAPDPSGAMTFRITVTGVGGSVTYDQTVPALSGAGATTSRDYLVWDETLGLWV